MSERLLENRDEGTGLHKTIQASIMKKEYNSMIPVSDKPRIGIHLDSS